MDQADNQLAPLDFCADRWRSRHICTVVRPKHTSRPRFGRGSLSRCQPLGAWWRLDDRRGPQSVVCMPPVVRGVPLTWYRTRELYMPANRRVAGSASGTACLASAVVQQSLCLKSQKRQCCSLDDYSSSKDQGPWDGHHRKRDGPRHRTFVLFSPRRRARPRHQQCALRRALSQVSTLRGVFRAGGLKQCPGDSAATAHRGILFNHRITHFQKEVDRHRLVDSKVTWRKLLDLKALRSSANSKGGLRQFKLCVIIRHMI